ncbi:MAG: TlyA family RNA methyltransferase [Candidatus Margulisbacteria bacterium]|nr:TlyA family RNA methyltransferase [Candidatus Margulisiibacteriota bacterium]
MAKQTLLEYLLEHGLTTNEDEAIKQVMAGNVIGEGRKFSSVHQKLKTEETVKLKKIDSKYVSRGGDKLASVFNNFDIQIMDKTGLDCGASTGGFTDFLLQNNASKIIAVDVGYGILDEKLRKDSRVINLDRINIRTLDSDTLQEKLTNHKNGPIQLPLDFCVADLSFISLNIILPVVKTFLRNNGDILVLYKPQFELPKELVPEGGIVTDNIVIDEYRTTFITNMKKHNLIHLKTLPSMVQGTKGNQEFFIHFKVDPNGETPI